VRKLHSKQYGYRQTDQPTDGPTDEVVVVVHCQLINQVAESPAGTELQFDVTVGAPEEEGGRGGFRGGRWAKQGREEMKKAASQGRSHRSIGFKGVGAAQH
jgi:hypothetical protein